MRVLLTGATGFIGSHAAAALARAGCEVHAAVRPASDPWRLRELAPEARTIPWDGPAAAAARAAVDAVRPHRLVHLAWPNVRGDQLAAADHLTALRDSLDLAAVAAAAGCEKFVGAGSVFEYDTARGYLPEDAPRRPNSLYAAAKSALWTALEHLPSAVGMATAWARVFYLYGPYEDPRRVIPAVVRSLLQGVEVPLTAGEQVVDYLHVHDVAAAVAAIAVGDAAGAFNVGSGQPVPLRRIAERVGDLVGRPDLLRFGARAYRPGEPQFLCADVSRLKATGWRPAFDLDRGLEHTTDWWRSRGR